MKIIRKSWQSILCWKTKTHRHRWWIKEERW